MALASASLASEHEHEIRNPQNDNFGDVPLLAQSTDDNIQGPFPVQKLLGIPGPVARQDGGGSPFDDELDARSPHIRSPTHSAAGPAVKLELKDGGEHQVDGRDAPKINELIHAIIPGHVKRAILDDPKAAEVLAKELSGTNVPRWYARLAETVTNYDATITPPPTLTVRGPQQEIVDYWIASLLSYKSMISSQLSDMVLLASSESREASRLSSEASSKSTYATHYTDTNLATSAWSESTKAATMSYEASSISSFAASASRAVFSALDDEDEQSRASSSSSKDMTLVLGSSIVGAVVCLGFAIAL
ncbi:hypothetical protein PV04_06424 [Phialophora macrospora]|uniref:Uncharacterized protein n=1 Tax=Phialophora macrospora TaxID=1851006 RepID=A0A0D2DYD7_9EURO|nr:hypothetical protein PV04_06424 [Phialophora macrospora]